METPSKELIVGMLDRFIRQRPGLEFGNYGDITAYRSELRSITKDFGTARMLLRRVELSSMTAEQLMEGFRAYSGRLTLAKRADGKWELDYCTGQYWPTEYRRAVCAVLASALWSYQREHMPAPVAHVVESWGKWDGSQFIKERSKPLGIHAACELLVEKGGQSYGHIVDIFKDREGRAKLSAGDYLRDTFRREFGRGIQSSYFN